MLKKLLTLLILLSCFTGYSQEAGLYNVSIGAGSSAIGNKSNIAIGAGSVVPSRFSNTVNIGSGTAIINGAFHYMGTPIFDKNGLILETITNADGTVVTPINTQLISQIETLISNSVTNIVISIDTNILKQLSNIVVNATGGVAGAINSVSAPATAERFPQQLLVTNVNRILIENGTYSRIVHSPVNSAESGKKTSRLLLESVPAIGTVRAPSALSFNSPMLDNTGVATLILTNGPNLLIRHDRLSQGEGEAVSLIRFEATSGIQGPQGVDGLGNIFVMGAYATTRRVATNGATIASYDGEVWITTNAGGAQISDTFPSDAAGGDGIRWSKFIEKGRDGIDGIGLRLITDFGPSSIVTTNDVFSYETVGLLNPKRNMTNPPAPQNIGLTNYNILIRNGVDSAQTNIIVNNFNYAGFWQNFTEYPSNSVVRYGTGLHVTRSNIPSQTSGFFILPGNSPWEQILIDGQNGLAGQNGLNGVANTYFIGEWQSRLEPYPSNVIVSYVRTVNNKPSLFVSRTNNVSGGLQPDAVGAQQYWLEIVRSGEDANILTYYFYPTYDDSFGYSNALVRYKGKVYYTKTSLQISGKEPDENPDDWGLFVQDGTTISTNLILRGSWSSGTTYYSNDLVTHLGSLYVQTNGSISGSDPTTSNNWLQLVGAGQQGPTGPTGPVNTIYVTNIFSTNVVLTQNVVSVTNASFVDTLLASTNILTNIILQPVDSGVNFLSYSNGPSPVRLGYLTYTVTNGGTGAGDGGITGIFSTSVLNSPTNYVSVALTGRTAFIGYVLTNGVAGAPGSGITSIDSAAVNTGVNNFITTTVTGDTAYLRFNITNNVYSIVASNGTAVKGPIVFQGSAVTQTGNVFNFAAGAGTSDGGITGIAVQAVNSSQNLISITNSVDGRAAYLSYTITNLNVTNILLTRTGSDSNYITLDRTGSTYYLTYAIPTNITGSVGAGNITNVLSVAPRLLVSTGAGPQVQLSLDLSGILTNTFITNAAQSDLLVYSTNGSRWTNVPFTSVGFATGSPVYVVTQTGQVNSITATTEVNGSVIFTGGVGIAITQTGSSFYVSSTQAGGIGSITSQSSRLLVYTGAGPQVALNLDLGGFLTNSFVTNGLTNDLLVYEPQLNIWTNAPITSLGFTTGSPVYSVTVTSPVNGAITLTGGTGIAITQTGSVFTVSSTGGGGIGSITNVLSGSPRLLVYTGAGPQVDLRLDLGGFLTNTFVTNGLTNDILVYDPGVNLWTNAPITSFGFATGSPVYAVIQTGQVDSIAFTSAVNGPITFTGSLVTQTNTTFNFDVTQTGQVNTIKVGDPSFAINGNITFEGSSVSQTGTTFYFNGLGIETSTLASVLIRGNTSSVPLIFSNTIMKFDGTYEPGSGTVNYIQFADGSKLYSANIANVAITNETDPVYIASLGTNNTWSVGTTQTFDTILVNGQNVNTNFLNVWGYLTNYPITNIVFNSISSSSNYFILNNISGLTAYVNYCVTNGGGGSASLLSTQIVNFAQNQSVTFSNAVALAIYDNSVATSEVATTLFNAGNELCLDTEDIKHDTTFILSTNGYRGQFLVSSSGSKVTDGSVMKIGNDWYPIYSITNGGTETGSVQITKWLQPNSTQTISRIQNIRVNDFNTSLSVAGGTNGALHIRNLPSKATVSSFYAGDGYWIIGVVAAKYNTDGSVPLSEYESTYISRDNGTTWYPFGATNLRSSIAYSMPRFGSSDGTNFVIGSGQPSASRNTARLLLATTNNFQTVDVLTNSGVRHWAQGCASRGGQIMYAAANSNLTGAGDYIYKSTDRGATWSPLTAALTRFWQSVHTIDGTNVIASTGQNGASASSLTGGVFFSRDGGVTWTNPPAVRTSTGSALAAGRIYSVIFVDTNKVYFWTDNVSAGVNGIRLTTNFGETSTRLIAHRSNYGLLQIDPTNSQRVLASSYFGGNFGIDATTNDFVTYETFGNPGSTDFCGVDYRSICFAPANPNIGYAVSADRLSGVNNYGYVYKTVNGGLTWSIISSLPNANWNVVATYDGNLVYAGISTWGSSSSYGPLYKSTDGGTNWTVLNNQRKPWTTLVMPTSNRLVAAVRLADTANTIANSAFETLLFEMDTATDNMSLIGGKYNAVLTQFAAWQVYSKGNKVYITGRITSGTGAGVTLVSTNYGETFDSVPGFVASGPYTSIALSTGTIGYASSYGELLSKTTNEFFELNIPTLVGDNLNRNRYQVWCSKDGQTVINTVNTAPNLSLLISTNGGSTFRVLATNQFSALGVTSPDDGDTIIVSRDSGSSNGVGIITNLFANPTQSNITFFVTNAPRMMYLSSYSNFVIGGGTGGTVHISYDKGLNWDTIDLGQNMRPGSIAIDDRDPNTNSFWFTSVTLGTSDMVLRYTTNRFVSHRLWQTNENATLQSIGPFAASAFTISYKNTNAFLYGTENNGPLYISTNNGVSYNTPTFLSGINNYWSGIASYDGDIAYAVPGLVNQSQFAGPMYRIDFKNQTWSYIDDPARTRSFTHVHTPNGINLYATTIFGIQNSINYTEIPTNGFYSVITSCSSPSSQFWTDINDTLSTYYEDYALGTELNLAFSFDNNSSFSVWKTNSWTCIMTNESGTWKYYDGTNFVASYSNTSVATLSDSMVYPSNRMSYIEVTSIPDSGWEQAGGFKTNSTTTVYIGASMRSTNIYVTPSISSFTFDVNKRGDLTKLNMEDYELIYQPTNNTQTIIRKGIGVTDAEVFYINK